MTAKERRDDPIDRAVRALVAAAAAFPTVAQADMAMDVIRAQLVEKIDVEADPDATAILRLVFGRLHDATETGGTRR
jgi:hypothetical protein